MNPNEADRLTLYDVLGGEDVIHATIEAVYRRIYDDFIFAFFIRGQDLEAAKDFMLELFSMLLLHGLPEDGEAMEENLAERLGRCFALGLDEQHFDLLQGHVVLALQSLGVNRLTVVEVVRTLLPLRKIFENGAIKARSRHLSARRSLSL